MYCPQCKAEYRQGFTRCADCDVDLVYERPASASGPGETGGREENPDDPFCSFWRGDDPRIHAELCELLNEEGIPHKTVRREDHLFNMNTKSAFETGIPFSQFEKAEAAIRDAYGSQKEEPESAATAAPEERDAEQSENNSTDWDPTNWNPREATLGVWSSEQSYPGEMIVMALRENQIHARFEKVDGRNSIFVLPEDETRAREIVKEVVEACRQSRSEK